jgi:beta-glucosidase
VLVRPFSYVADTLTSVTRAERELKAFSQVQVMPGESVEVDLSVAARSCSIVDQNGQRIVEPGSFELLVGRNCLDSRMLSAQFHITA